MDNNEISQDAFDRTMMARALDLASRGSGFVSPNPMVGALIVDADRYVIAEGWHKRFGEAHAEINALKGVEGKDLTGATMYVTLEPCSHFGKTPPCADAIIASGIKRVVVAMRDPNVVVSGKGIKKLREANIEVVVGVLESDARELNEAYIHYISTGSPYVTIKVAQTLDGFTALPSGESQWITGELARERVHRLRAGSDAVMIGRNTAIKDNPSLTIRYDIQSRMPRRIVIDETMDLPDSLRLFTDEHREQTIVFTTQALADGSRAVELRRSGITVHGVPLSHGGLKLDDIFRKLGEMDIASVLIEGGATLHGSMLKEGIVHKVMFFIAPKLFGHGIKIFQGVAVDRLINAYRFDVRRMELVGEDTLLTAYVRPGATGTDEG